MSDKELMFTLGLIEDLWQADAQLDQDYETAKNPACAGENREERLVELSDSAGLTVDALRQMLALVPAWRTTTETGATSALRLQVARIRTEGRTKVLR